MEFSPDLFSLDIAFTTQESITAQVKNLLPLLHSLARSLTHSHTHAAAGPVHLLALCLSLLCLVCYLLSRQTTSLPLSSVHSTNEEEDGGIGLKGERTEAEGGRFPLGGKTRPPLLWLMNDVLNFLSVSRRLRGRAAGRAPGARAQQSRDRSSSLLTVCRQGDSRNSRGQVFSAATLHRRPTCDLGLVSSIVIICPLD